MEIPFEFKIVFAPLILMCLDVIFGYIGAMRQGNVNSSIMRDGLWNKTMELMVIAIGFAAQFCISVFGESQLGFTVDIPISTGICAYLCVYELTSIIENIGKFDYNIGVAFIKLFGIDPSKVGLIPVDDSNDNSDNNSNTDSGVVSGS